SVAGTLTLNANANPGIPSIDVSVTSPEGVLLASNGDVVLNVSRGTPNTAADPSDETSGDARIVVNGTPAIVGANSIALNGFWHYSPADSGTIVQDNGGATPVTPVIKHTNTITTLEKLTTVTTVTQIVPGSIDTDTPTVDAITFTQKNLPVPNTAAGEGADAN